jgi:hypothetical protein
MTLAQTLIADPTFGLMTRAERIDEALALMRSADPETEPDALEAALAVEEAEGLLTAGGLAPSDATAVLPAGLEPCREDRPSCGAPIAGNGRCLECGARRAAEMVAVPHLLRTPEIYHVDALSPETLVQVSDKDAEFLAARLKKQDLKPAEPRPPVLARFKAATAMSDKDIGDLLNLPRSTVQATVSGRIAEKLTPKQLRALLDALNQHRDLTVELKADLAERL